MTGQGTPPVDALWNGSPRPTKFVSGQLTMTLFAEDLATPGLNEITVFDKQSGTMWAGGCKFPVHLQLSANDLIYDSRRGRFYASLPSIAGPRGNNVVAIDPATGDITAAVFVGSEPNRMAISDDLQWLYVFNDGANSIVRISLDSFRADAPFYTGGIRAYGLHTTPVISVLPGSPNSVLVSQNGRYKLFDSGTSRSKSAEGSGVVAWTDPANFVNFVPQRFTVDPSGVNATFNYGTVGGGGYIQDVTAAGGRVYTSSGQVFDAINLALLGRFDRSGVVEVDAANHRVFFLGDKSGVSYGIAAFDTNTFIPQGTVAIPGVNNTYGDSVSRLVRFGPDGIAFSFCSPETTREVHKVFLLRSPLFGPAPVISKASIVNAASGRGGAIAPGEIVTIYGTGLGPAVARTMQLSSPTTIDAAAGDTRVFFNGVAAPILFTSQNQVNAVVPYVVSRFSSVTVEVSHMDVLSNSVVLPVEKAIPALFTADGTGSGPAAASNQDGSPNSAAHPAARGSVITLYATGEGQTNPLGSDGKIASPPLPAPAQGVTATIGGVSALVQYAGGAPGLVAGVMQVNVTVPDEVSPTAAARVVLNVGGVSSPDAVTVAIR
jgi:uncharacterized protein (TIGR03437 family)